MTGTPLQPLIALLGLDGRNWRKHHLNDSEGRFCLLGGVCRTYSRLHDSFGISQNKVVRTLASAIKGEWLDPKDESGFGFIITSYNDAPTRKWPEIREVIETAERMLLEEHEENDAT